jgi:Regulator of chromosome condensation (RCC1) repeat
MRLLAVALLLGACASPRPGSPAVPTTDGRPEPSVGDAAVGADDGGDPDAIANDDAALDTGAPPPSTPDGAPPPPDMAPKADAAPTPMGPPEPPGSDRPLVATRIVAGANHTCALHENGTVRCWGHNGHGQLGRPRSMLPQSRPLSVLGLTGARAIAAGANHTCAIVADGTVQCWGWNVNGQLGNGTLTDADSPAPARRAVGVDGATAISARGPHTCALVSGGRLMCWGGIVPSGDWTIPGAIPGVDGATAISVGDVHRCILKGGSSPVLGLQRQGPAGRRHPDQLGGAGGRARSDRRDRDRGRLRAELRHRRRSAVLLGIQRSGHE